MKQNFPVTIDILYTSCDEANTVTSNRAGSRQSNNLRGAINIPRGNKKKIGISLIIILLKPSIAVTNLKQTN